MSLIKNIEEYQIYIYLLLWKKDDWRKRKELKLKNICETGNYFTKEADQNELMSKKHKKSLYDFKL